MKQVKNDSKVKVHYTGKFENGNIFDTTKTEYRTPMEASLGKGELIKGFENGLIGMEEGQTKTVEINPENAYGEVLPNLINEVPLNLVPSDVYVGAILQAKGPNGDFNVSVKEIKEETVVLDANHPLAGKTLIFELEVVEIMD